MSSSSNFPNFSTISQSFDDLSNKYAKKSPIGNNSVFQTLPNGEFVDSIIDKKLLAQEIIEHSNKNKLVEYNLIRYNLGTVSRFNIDGQDYDVGVELNTLSGQIDFSKHPSFKFNFKIEKQTTEFKLLYEFVKFKDSAEKNRIAIILTFYYYDDFKTFLDKISKELVDPTKERIKKEFNTGFKLAKGQSEVLDFIYETAPDFVIADRKDEDLYSDLELLSNKSIDRIGTNENNSILKILDGFKDKKWFYDNVNKDPGVVKKLFENFSFKYIQKLIISVSKIGYSVWTKEDKKSALKYELDYSEFESFYADKSNLNEPYITFTGFAYYDEKFKKYKIGTFIAAFDTRLSALASMTREIGPAELQYAYTPMKIQFDKITVYIPVFVAEYFTNEKIDEEWWTMFQNLTAGLLPEESASVRGISTLTKLFSGKKIQTVEELIKFLNKIDDTVKATELEQFGIEALFRGTTRNAEGELFIGNAQTVENGASTSTDPIRAVIYGIESATVYKQQGVLQIFATKDLEGLNLLAPNRRVFKELEVVIGTTPDNLSNFAVIEIPIEDARKLVNEVYSVGLDSKMDRASADLALVEKTKLTPKEASEFYKKVIKLKK